MFYFQTNALGFTPEFLGRVRLAGALASLAGVGVYNAALKDVPLRRMFLWTSVLGAGLGLTQILLITGARLWARARTGPAFHGRAPWAPAHADAAYHGRAPPRAAGPGRPACRSSLHACLRWAQRGARPAGLARPAPPAPRAAPCRGGGLAGAVLVRCRAAPGYGPAPACACAVGLPALVLLSAAEHVRQRAHL